MPDAPPSRAVSDRLSRLHTWLLSTATHRGHRLLTEHLASAGLRMHHYLVMVALAELARPTQTDIGNAVNIDTGNLVALLNDLEEKDYLARTPDPANRRRNIVQITTAGRRALTHLDQLTDQANNALLEPLTGPEREQLRNLLSRITGNRPPD